MVENAEKLVGHYCLRAGAEARTGLVVHHMLSGPPSLASLTRDALDELLSHIGTQ